MPTPKLINPASGLENQKNIVRKSFLFSTVTFVIVVIVVLGFWRYAANGVKFRQKIKFEAFSNQMSSLIESRIQNYVDILDHASRLFLASQKVERKEWKLFVDPDRLQKRYPGIQAMRFIERVPVSDLSSFIEQVRKDTSIHSNGYPNFQVQNLKEEGINEVKSDVYLVNYVEPYEGNENMMGLDISSEQFRWNLYEHAWVTGVPSIGKINLAENHKPSFTVCFPIYKMGLPISSVQEKKEAHIGFVDIVFDPSEFFKSIFAKNSFFSQVQYEVFEGDVSDPSQSSTKLLFQNWQPLETESMRKLPLKFRSLIRVPDSSWTVFFYASSEFAKNEIGQEIPQIVLFGGIILGFLLWAVLYVMSTSRFNAVVMAAKMTEDLRESEERFRAITQSATDAIISVNNKGSIIFWNEGAEKTFGYSNAEILGKNVTTLMPERYRQARQAGMDMDQFLKTQEKRLIGRTVEVHGIRKNNTEFPVEASLANWQRGKEQFFTAILRDISERKSIELELQLNRDRYAKLLHEAPDPIITFDEFGVLQTANLATEGACGYPAQDLIGKHVSQIAFISPSSRQKMVDEFSLLISKKERLPYEIEVISSHEDLKIFEVNPRLILTDEKIEAIQIIFRDQTERRKAQKREVTEHSAARMIAESKTLEEVLFQITQLICSQFGWMLGIAWLVDAQASSLKFCVAWNGQSSLKPSPKPFETVPKKKNILIDRVLEHHEYLWLSDVSTYDHLTERSELAQNKLDCIFILPVGDQNGILAMLEFCGIKMQKPDTGMITMFRSIANQMMQFIQRKSIESQLSEAQQSLVDREKSAMVAQLAAGVAHEVKNPLNILLQGTDYLKSDGKLKSAQDVEVVDLMANAVNRADQIIRGLLELSRPEALHLNPENIHTVIETSLLLVKNQLNQRSISVHTHLSSSLPKIKIDRGKVEQVLINVFSNAIEAMDQGGELTITTKMSDFHRDAHVSEAEKSVVIEVSDTGAGIPESLLSKIFTPFVTSKRATGGSGLGLPIVRNIMEMHKGMATVENIKGKGTKVSLIFPI